MITPITTHLSVMLPRSTPLSDAVVNDDDILTWFTINSDAFVMFSCLHMCPLCVLDDMNCG